MTRHPLQLYPDDTVVLPPVYCGSIGYYAVMASFGRAVIDFGHRWNKREKECHRCTIAGANGPQRLTVPLEKPQQWHGHSVGDAIVSTHGEWWNVHWGAIYSAYGNTPFFEYYADDIHPVFDGSVSSLKELDLFIDRTCRKALGIETAIIDNPSESASDYTVYNRELEKIRTVPYYQVWESRFGFTPGLSALDIIFNMGPEAPLVIREMLGR